MKKEDIVDYKIDSIADGRVEIIFSVKEPNASTNAQQQIHLIVNKENLKEPIEVIQCKLPQTDYYTRLGVLIKAKRKTEAEIYAECFDKYYKIS